MTARVRIETPGRLVEIQEDGRRAEDLQALAEALWPLTEPDPARPMGFAPSTVRTERRASVPMDYGNRPRGYGRRRIADPVAEAR